MESAHNRTLFSYRKDHTLLFALIQIELGDAVLYREAQAWRKFPHIIPMLFKELLSENSGYPG